MALRIRKNQAHLTSDERKQFVAAVKTMKANGSYDYYVKIHIQSMSIETPGADMNMWAHQRPGFLPWHRQLILDFENDLRAADIANRGVADTDLTLPYWDWVNYHAKKRFLWWGRLWGDDFLGPDGDSSDDNKVTSGPFSAGQWTCTYAFAETGKPYLQRTLGRGGTPAIDTLPTQEQWDAAQAIMAAVAATGSITFTGQPTASQTVTLNGTVVTFVASGAVSPQVNIGPTLQGTLTNFLTMANASADAQLVKFKYSIGPTTIQLTAATAGTGGNSLTLATNVTGATASGATLAGGQAVSYDVAPWDPSVSTSPPPTKFAGVTSYRNCNEGWIPWIDGSTNEQPTLHNRVHVWVGGAMAPISSPNDPVFFLHHCNVDRMWADWWNRLPPALKTSFYVPLDGVPDPPPPPPPEMAVHLAGHHLHDDMRPWDGLARQGRTPPHVRPIDVFDHIRLGYKYDTDPPSLGATSP